MGDEIEAAIAEAGLRDDLIRLGLTRQLGSGSGMSSSIKRRIGLVRAMIKRPRLLVLDGIANTDSGSDRALRFAILSALPETSVLYAAADTEAADDADFLVQITDTGATTISAVAKSAPDPSMTS